MLKGFPDLPPVWLVGLGFASTLLGWIIPIFRFNLGFITSLLIWAGVGIIIWSAVYFLTKKTPIEPNHTPKTLIVEGPYKLSRNPIYLGLVLILAGWALGQGALTALIPAVIFPRILQSRFIEWEEQTLRDTFGSEADAYLAQTARWISRP